MAHAQPDGEMDRADPLEFVVTPWPLVQAAGDPDQARRALEQLCCRYWESLYACFRRRGYELHDAQDLTQFFFAHLLAKHVIEAADPQRGRFRCYLLTCLKNFLATEHEKANVEKRGGGSVQ